jgi:hypothetical protein
MSEPCQALSITQDVLAQFAVRAGHAKSRHG